MLTSHKSSIHAPISSTSLENSKLFSTRQTFSIVLIMTLIVLIFGALIKPTLPIVIF